MPVMKTAELQGAALDWAVTRAIEAKAKTKTEVWSGALVVLSDHDAFEMVPFQPSVQWSQGGPLMDRHEIDTVRCNDLYFPKGNENGDLCEPYWKATIDGGTDAGVPLYKTYGPTRLIAAMRCLVESRLGDTVDVPGILAA